MSTIYLYVKQHKITGIKYFGVTKKKDPFRYNGSGVRWGRHISKHGKEHIKTIEVWGFDDPDICKEFALKFSYDNDIVNSPEWANLIVEDTIIRYTGGSEKHKRSAKSMWEKDEYRKKQSISHKKAWQNNSYREDQTTKRKNNWQSSAYRSKTIIAGIQSRKSQEYLNNQQSKAKAQWSNLEFREKELLRRKEATRKIWITDGIISRTIPNTDQIPYGFVKGRKKK
jgi:hypothetical protein